MFFSVLLLIASSSCAEEPTGKPNLLLLEAEVIEMLNADQLRKLDQRLLKYDQTLERDKDGLTKINDVFFPLTSAILARKDALKLIHKWKALVPASYFPDMIDAQRLFLKSSEARGEGISASVSRTNWETAQGYADEAIRKLKLIKFPNGIKSPIYYNIRLSLVATSSLTNKRDALYKIFKEAIAQHPTYYFSYFITLDRLQTKWYGKSGEIFHFIKEEADLAEENYSDELYTRMAWTIVDNNIFFNTTSKTRMVALDYFYKYPKIEWSRMRKGFEKIIAVYPSPWNLNNFAWFACVAGDKETAQRLLGRVEKQPIQKLWGGAGGYRSWVKWIKQPDYPVANTLKSNWKTTKIKGITVKARSKKKDYTSIEYSSENYYFEGAVYADSALVKGLAYKKIGLSETKGAFTGMFYESDIKTDGSYWQRDNYGTESESIFRGLLFQTNPKIGLESNIMSIGLKQLKGGSSYFGVRKNQSRTGLGRLQSLNAGFQNMPEIYYGEFKNNTYDGFGVLAGSKIFDGYTFIGTFKNGKPIGVGAIINLPIWSLTRITNSNISFIKYNATGAFEAVEKDPNGKFDFIHYKNGNNVISYVGYVKNGMPNGYGISLNRSGHFAISKWEGTRYIDDYIYIDRYEEGFLLFKTQVITKSRNGVVYQGYWRGGRLVKEAVIFPDGRILQL